MLRTASAVVLAPLAIGTAYIGGWPFTLFWAVAAIAVLWEWLALVAGPNHKVVFFVCGSAIASAAVIGWQYPFTAILIVGLGALISMIFAPNQKRVWFACGVAYAGLMLLAPMLLRGDNEYGMLAIIFLFAIVWTTDIVAYFAGRTFGGPKLCPSISPKKTWSGAVTGVLGAMLAGIAVTAVFDTFNWIAIAAIGFLLSMLSQMGDLLESWIKRRFGAKDASHLIPGHGGAMDRLDGFWAAALAGCLIGLLHGGFNSAGQGLLVW